MTTRRSKNRWFQKGRTSNRERIMASQLRSIEDVDIYDAGLGPPPPRVHRYNHEWDDPYAYVDILVDVERQIAHNIESWCDRYPRLAHGGNYTPGRKPRRPRQHKETIMARKRTEDAVEAFLNHRSAHPARSIWTDGDSLWSYDTVIATHSPLRKVVIVNTTHYSPTTAEKQRGLLLRLRQLGLDHVELDNLNWYARPRDLLEAWADQQALLAAFPVGDWPEPELGGES